MKMFLPLILGLLFPLSAALAQDKEAEFRKQALALCKSTPGSTVVLGDLTTEGDKYCKTVNCSKASAVPGESAEVKYAGKACVDKKEIDDRFNDNNNGRSRYTRDINGDGVKDENDDIDSDGDTDDDDARLYAQGRRRGDNNSNNNNNNNNRNNRNNNDDDDVDDGPGGSLHLDDCNYTLKSGHPCWKKCTKWDRSLKKYVRKHSRRCSKCLGDNGIHINSTSNNGRGNNAVTIGGVDCSASGLRRGPNGECIEVSTGRRSGSGSGSGGSRTDIHVSGRDGVDLPAFCREANYNKKDCERWMSNNRFRCSSSSRTSDCIGDDDYHRTSTRYDRDCQGGNCRGGRGGRNNAWLGDALGALFTAGGQVGSAYFQGRAFERSNQAWAGAAAVGFEQCQISQNNYLSYLSTNELPSLSPDQRNAMNCNGYQLGGFGGMGNGGMGAWMGAGYTPGMIGGMMGPYGGYNPYGGFGGAVGGVAGGYPGGYAGGYPAGYNGGMIGGAIQGAVQGGYAAGGYPAGYAGGYAQGGYPAGYAGGFAQGGYPAGYAGGFAQGGYAGGYPAGYNGGAMGGIGLVQGAIGGGGFAQGGGGYINGGGYGGYINGGGGGYGGYINGGGFGGNGGFGGYGQPGGWGSGVGNGYGGFGGYGGQGNYWGASGGGQMDYSMSNNAANYDRMLQNQGMSYQMGAGGGGGFGGGFGGGSAGFSPFNAGISLGGQFGTFGF